MFNKAANKIAIFGGTFDPIHLGHLEIAKAAKKQFDLDEIHFVLAKNPPSKDKTLFEAEQRYEMLESTLADTDALTLDFILAFKPSRVEMEREGISYSYQTIEYFKKTYPQAEIYWILGLDAFLDLDNWKNADYIKSNVNFLVYPRRKFSKDDSLPDHLNISKLTQIKPLIQNQNNTFLIDGDFQDISSQALRSGIAHGKPISEKISRRITPLVSRFTAKIKN